MAQRGSQACLDQLQLWEQPSPQTTSLHKLCLWQMEKSLTVSADWIFRNQIKRNICSSFYDPEILPSAFEPLDPLLHWRCWFCRNLLCSKLLHLGIARQAFSSSCVLVSLAGQHTCKAVRTLSVFCGRHCACCFISVMPIWAKPFYRIYFSKQ